MIIKSPWTEDQVESLNAYQESGVFHEFTSPAGNTLVATPGGWMDEGHIVQDWCWDWMANWGWKKTAV